MKRGWPRLALALAMLAAAPARAGDLWAMPAFGGQEPACSVWMLEPLDVSSLNLLRELGVRLARDAAAAPAGAAALQTDPASAGGFVPGDGAVPDYENASGAKVSQPFEKVTVVSSSSSYDAFLETMGLGRVSVRNLVDIWGAADINTMQITAWSTADFRVFRVPVGRSAALFGLAGARIYLVREADFCVTCPGSWDTEAVAVGGGLGLELPGLGPRSPLQISVGGGPTLLWGSAGAGAPSSSPQLGGTVLAKVELVVF